MNLPMKKRLVSCCIAALTFAACTDDFQPVPRPIEPKRVTAPVRTPPPVAVAAFDAGKAMAVEEPADLIALKHDQPGVDHLGRAKQLSSEGDRAGALTEARRAIFTSPSDEDALSLVATLAQKTGKHAMSAEAYGRIGQLRPDDAVPLVQQARALVKAKAFDRAAMVGKEAVKRDGGNPEAFQAAGLGYLGNGELQSAIFMFSKVIELNPDHGWALNNLGLAYLRANENEKAVEVLSRSAELLPATAYVHNNLGVALERVGRHDEAKQAYLTSTTLSPKYVKARINADRVAKVGTFEEIDFEQEAPDMTPEN
jgi:tetratricopeptide (TPR) repeat protein